MAARQVSLLDSIVFLKLEGGARLEWQGDGRSVSKEVASGPISILPANHPYSVRLRAPGGGRRDERRRRPEPPQL